MSIYRLTKEKLVPLPLATFAKYQVQERQDLQRYLREDIGIIDSDLLVIGEEFCDWEDSSRRIDLLAVDKMANLVVIELKRDDSAHMELQALRYAAMVSTMTFAKAVDIYERHLQQMSEDGDARAKLLAFLGWDEPAEDLFGQDVRILLISGDFSKELTTSVIWLNERGLDIRCVRLRGYEDQPGGDTMLVNVEQIIPLPETQDYQVRIREKSGREREDRAERSECQALRFEFWQDLLKLAKQKSTRWGAISATTDSWVAAGIGIGNVGLQYDARVSDSQVSLILYASDAELNRKRFDALYANRETIEAAFGGKLLWKRGGDGVKRCSIAKSVDGGYRSDRAAWPDTHLRLVDAMNALDKAMSVHLTDLSKF